MQQEWPCWHCQRSETFRALLQLVVGICLAERALVACRGLALSIRFMRAVGTAVVTPTVSPACTARIATVPNASANKARAAFEKEVVAEAIDQGGHGAVLYSQYEDPDRWIPVGPGRRG